MKKSIILLVSALLSLGTIQAANTYKKCPGESQELTTTHTGDSYQWYKDGSPISGATKNTYTVKNISADATYKCVTTKKGTTTDTGNLITLGGFEFPCDNPKTSETNRLGSNVWYSYLNFDQSGRDIAIGATTTATNANNVKTKYFCKLKPYSGNYLYVCDGANSSSARVWQAGGIKLPKGKYQFSCHVANIDSAYSTHGSNSLAKLKFVIKNDDGEKELLSFKAPTTLGKWEERKATFEATKDYGWCDIYIINYTTDPEGNDFALDEIYFGTEIKGDDTTEEESFKIELKNCTDTETIDHPLVTECPNQTVTLTLSKEVSEVKNIKWSTGETNTKTITVTSSSTVNESNPDKYSCTYEITSNGITTTYTENFSVATKNCTDSNKEEQKVQIGGEVTVSSKYTGTPGATYEWFKIEEDGTKTPVGDGSESITFTAQEGVTYECITTLPDGKVVTETRVVIVYNDTEETVYVCDGEDITLTAKTANAYSYHWTEEGREEILSTNQTLPLNEVTSKAKYTCNIVASDESTKIKEIYNLEVNSNPELEIQVSATTAYINISKGTAPYTLVLDSDTTSTKSATYTIEELEEGQHILLITDKNKCKNSKSFNVHIPKLEPMIFFSPNNDGLNDLWLVKGIEDAANATIMIYDRYSKLLYKCKGADFKGWDGTYNKHDMVQDDYWYVIQVPETNETISGHFILKR